MIKTVRLFKVYWYADGSWQSEWKTTVIGASDACTYVLGAYGRSPDFMPPRVKTIDIPLDREKLAVWLTANYGECA